MATIEDFQRLDLRVGRITAAVDHPEARKPSVHVTVDFGFLGLRESIAALRTDYALEELIGRQVVCVMNLPPRRIAGFKSEVLVLAATEASGRLRLLSPGPEAELGSPIT